MKIKGQISMFFDENGLRMELRDKNAITTFAEIVLNKEETCSALARHGYTPCEIEVRNLERIGRKHEHKTFEFEIPTLKIPYNLRENTIIALAKKHCPNGWIPDLYFSSQDSFFNKDGKSWARTTIRRWIWK